MISGLTSLLLYAYLGIVRHRNRKGQASRASVTRAYVAVGIAFFSFLLVALLTTLLNSFRTTPWVHSISPLPGAIDVTGAIVSVAVAARAEWIQRKETANKALEATPLRGSPQR